MDFAAACEAMAEAEKRFQRLDRHAQEGVPEDMVEWFDALESRYLTDKKLWELFTAGDRSVRSNKMYNEYRLILLRGESTRADAYGGSHEAVAVLAVRRVPRLLVFGGLEKSRSTRDGSLVSLVAILAANASLQLPTVVMICSP
jgi:hypothetical protein